MESMNSKTKRKNIPKSVSEMSSEMLRETLKKKKECNAKALQTVEKLCEEEVDEKWFLANLQFINQCHFDDATIERSISKICGYPLCDQKLIKVPAQQYHISTRYNKVFDITERKNFCSSSCYKSAMHVKKQLFTSPLWFRDQEVIPKYTVLKSLKSSLGEEVNFFPDKIQPEPEDVKKTISLERAVNLNESINKLEESCSNLTIEDTVEQSQYKTKMNILSDLNTFDTDKNKINLYVNIKNVKKESNENNECMQKNKLENDVSVPNSVEGNSVNKRPVKTEETKSKIKIEPMNVIKKIEKSIFDWFSLNTFFYLYGEEKLKELLQDKAVEVKKVLNSKLLMSNHNDKINKVIQLCGLLDTNSFNSNEIKTNLKPLPSYSALKEEGKNFEIKVRAFYDGQLVVKPARGEEEEEKKKEQESQIDSNPTYMPLIDSHAQIALRRKIILDKLNRVVPDLIKIFSSDYVLKMNDVRNLVTTFTLAAHNITFKPSEWYLVGIIIIKLLCLVDKQLESIMKLESTESQILGILMSFKLPKDYLDNLLLKLTDSKNLIEKLNEING